MPFVKVVKNKAYFKRYQTKFRRRREGRTDYRARKRLITQDKNKYMSPKYRFCVRMSNTTVTCQIIYARLEGDHVLCEARSSELPRYGLSVGLKNYPACYCTGLLLARRLLQKTGLDEAYPAVEEVNGEVAYTEMDGRDYYVNEINDDKRPFRALLDVGIRDTTTGARVWGALKGASDGGLDIPHSEKRFPGYDREAKKYEAEEHRDRIFGEHVKEYMEHLQEEDPERYAKQFASFIKAGVGADDLEELYENTHKAIIADPSPSPKFEYAGTPDGYSKAPKGTLEERKAKIQAKKDAAAEAEEEEEEDEEEEEEETGGGDY